VEDGRGEAHRIQHRAAAYGDGKGLPVDAPGRQSIEDSLDAVVLVLDGLPAGHGHDVAGDLEHIRMLAGIVTNLRGQGGTGEHHALVDEHRRAMALLWFEPGQRPLEAGIRWLEDVSRKVDGILITDREGLQRHVSPRAVAFSLEHRLSLVRRKSKRRCIVG